MSNQAVGNVYQTIIEEVINSSRVDFEESGVEEAVLEELRLGWQQKLTQLDVARFPWDPKPDPPVTAATAPPATLAQPAHSQSQFSPQLPLPTGATGVTPHNANGTVLEPGQIKQEPGVSIKQEPGAPPNFNPADTTNKNNLAANRAAQQLQAQYGIRAAGSINAIQGQHAQQQQQQQYTQPGQPPVGNGQTDGPGDDDDDDFEGILLQRSAAGDLEELGRVEIDRILHQQMAAKAKSMEGGGLMLSLQEASKQQAASAAVLKRKKKATEPGVAAYDGGDDEDEIDEDAINSDLDDPEDEHDDDEVDDEGLGHIMLCMYDKVQRVKNKWKCTLKDGVLTVNGKEYVFSKATGEYEW